MTDKPLLLLKRLLITSHKKIAYDQAYSEGINIIRGENGCGKSTITDMIFYVLGGENVEWTVEAESCDWVYAEFNVSDLVLSLRRGVTSESVAPIAVCEGPLSITMKTVVGWSTYGRMRSHNKESFSQFMFDHLHLPQTKSADSKANLTMYQVLRLLYSDQNTDSTAIFRRERQPFADRQDIRRSIGEMLLGIDDLKSHELRQAYIGAVKQLSSKKTRLDSLHETAFKADPNFNLCNYSDLIKKAEIQQMDLNNAIEELSQETEQAKNRTKDESQYIVELEKQLSMQNVGIERNKLIIDSLSLNIADSELFIISLESNLIDLISANQTRGLIGDIALAYCPICLTSLSKTEGDHCPLCKAIYSGDAISGGRLRFEQELKHQIRESKQIYSGRSEKLIEHEINLKEMKRKRALILEELRSYVSPTCTVNVKASNMLKEIGYIERTIENYIQLEPIQSEIATLEKDVIAAKTRCEKMERQLKHRYTETETRRTYCQNFISDLTVDILHQDIIDSDNNTLSDSKGLVYSFEKDFLSVRHGRLSASTQAFLKNSFYLALLKFAIVDEQCRLPRFFILDNIEDKGMVPERFRKFHHMLVQYSAEAKSPHQVILTTSYIDDELNNSQYCVGPEYDCPPYTLNIE